MIEMSKIEERWLGEFDIHMTFKAGGIGKKRKMGIIVWQNRI